MREKEQPPDGWRPRLPRPGTGFYFVAADDGDGGASLGGVDGPGPARGDVSGLGATIDSKQGRLRGGAVENLGMRCCSRAPPTSASQETLEGDRGGNARGSASRGARYLVKPGAESGVPEATEGYGLHFGFSPDWRLSSTLCGRSIRRCHFSLLRRRSAVSMLGSGRTRYRFCRYVFLCAVTVAFQLMSTPALHESSTYRDSHTLEYREASRDGVFGRTAGTPHFMDLPLPIISQLMAKSRISRVRGGGSSNSSASHGANTKSSPIDRARSQPSSTAELERIAGAYRTSQSILVSGAESHKRRHLRHPDPIFAFFAVAIAASITTHDYSEHV